DANEFVNPKTPHAKSNTGYLVKYRKVNTTFATIPFILKLTTSEYNGIKYFGMFGAELGYRLKASATDTYFSYHTFPTDTTVSYHDGEFSEPGINISEDASLVPLRICMNL